MGPDTSPTELRMKWKYLERRHESNYQQFFVVGTRIRASALIGSMVAGGYTEDEVAEDFGVPIGAVREASEYCRLNFCLIEAEEADANLCLAQMNFIK
jgi:uncharacterized protein (DUF433 family)